MKIIIGSGRLARHLNHYFNLLDISHHWWNRRTSTLENLDFLLNEASNQESQVYLAISDSAIYPFFEKHLKGKKIQAVHFSGLLSFPEIPSAHPLMSFGNTFFDLSVYEKIHFTISGVTQLSELLPGLKNPYSIISAENKAYYHSLCVLGGNFSQVLIKKMVLELEALQIPKQASELYLNQIIKNTFIELEHVKMIPKDIQRSKESRESLLQKCLPSSGPLVRKDLQTLKTHLEVLAADPFSSVYKSILDLFLTSKSKETNSYENNI
ncbi:MAG TPA: DUF2520 domain-containing protein [Pseudobdellovibrionaceae bacterium]|nr:DUF2520 domain-containing protein [Pseudobdellovibrionaceae bacterium]